MRKTLFGIPIIVVAFFVSTAQAQEPPVSLQFTLAAGGGTIMENEAEVTVTLNAVAISIDLPNGDILEPVNRGEVTIGETTYEQCTVVGTFAGSEGCEVTLECNSVNGEGQDPPIVIDIVPGNPETGDSGSIDGVSLTEGMIVTQCLNLPPAPAASSPARFPGFRS